MSKKFLLKKDVKKLLLSQKLFLILTAQISYELQITNDEIYLT